MKLNKVFPIAAITFVILLGGCNKEMDPALQNPNLTAGNSEGRVAVVLHYLPYRTGINLGTAGNYAILSESGVTSVYPSSISGNVGTGPISGTALLLRCTEIYGNIYTVDAAGPLDCRITDATGLTTAVKDMKTAYTEAAMRMRPNFLNLGGGNIGGKTLTPGVYKWTSPVVIPANVTISGGPNDVWIFQVDGTLDMSPATSVFLSGGAQAKNIYWQSAGAVTIGTDCHFEGIILGKTGINLQTNAVVNGRLLAQTAVTLQMNSVRQPTK